MTRRQPAGRFLQAFGLLTLCSAAVLPGCSESTASDPAPPSVGLDVERLDSLFINFSPVYNYTEEETVLLGHAVRVSAPGVDPWTAVLGHQDRAGITAVHETSLFRIASTTKLFTATLILQLWEEGLLELDVPFNEYLDLNPDTHPTVSQFSAVTVRHLLSHRSGIPRISSTTFFDHHDYTDPITQEERMTFLFTEGVPEFEPGSQYAYRNSNFNILGLVIEAVAGAPYHQVLQERIYIPLGLTHTHLLDHDVSRDDPGMAHGYYRGFDGTDYHGSQAWAAGGLVSTAADLSAFMTALAHGALFQDPSTFQLMVSPEPGSPYGLGIFLSNTQQGLAYGHSGAIFGFNSRLEYFPNLDAVVTATMSFDGIDFQAVNWMEDFCLPAIGEVRRAGY